MSDRPDVTVRGFACSPEVSAKINAALAGVDDAEERVRAVEEILSEAQEAHDLEQAALVDCEGFPLLDQIDADGKTGTVRRTKFKGVRSGP